MTSEKALLESARFFLEMLASRQLLVWRVVRVTVPAPKNSVGISDLLVWVKNGPALCLELKTKAGTQRWAQKRFEREIKAIGHRYFIVRSIEDLHTVLIKNGLPELPPFTPENYI